MNITKNISQLYNKEDLGVIVMNRMYSGDYLVDDNIGHEVINLYMADNGKYYLYLNALGSFDFKWENRIKSMVMVRTIKGAKMLEVLGIALGLKDVYKYGTKSQEEYIKDNNVSYAGKRIDEIFKDNVKQQDICITFEADRVLLPTKRILIAFSDTNKAIDDNDKETVVYLSGINQAKASLKQYIEDTDYNAYESLKQMINMSFLWNSSVGKVNESQIEVHEDTFFDICGINESELAFSNAIAYFFEKYPDLFSGFMKTQNIDFDLTDKFKVYRELRNIDLLFTNGKKTVVIENKINSGINGLDKHDPKKSQLAKYYYILTGGKGFKTKEDANFRKQFKNPHFFLLRPNYNNVDITEYECYEHYTEICYSDLFEFLRHSNIIKNHNDFLFENYVMALEPHTKEYDNELYETMKKRFFAKINE